MKILLINDAHSTTGGAENYFFELKNRLKQTSGIEVYSMGFSESEQEGEDFYVFKAAHSNFKKLIWRLIPNPRLYYKIRARLKKIKPDVIHIHNARQYTATLLPAISQYPVVQTVHDHGLVCPFGQNIHHDQQPCASGFKKECYWNHHIKFNKVAYILLTLAFSISKKLTQATVKQFITVSPGLEKILKLHFPQRIQYIPPFRVETTEESNNPPNPCHFLFAGSIARHKGIHILIHEFALACHKNPLLMLNIAGNGPEEAEMKKLIQTLGLTNNVRFLGWKTKLSQDYFNNLSLIFPSIGLEGFPLVITEAMNHARPIIGVNRGTTAWLVEDGKTGLLFDPLKRGDLAEKILYLANHPTVALELGQKGRQRIQKLIDNEAALNNIIKIYHETL